MKTWTDPELGTFERDDYYWSSELNLPAFVAFTFKGFWGPAYVPGPKVELRIEADSSEKGAPDNELVEVARLILQNQTSLVEKGVQALYDDFTGEGPSSGMWWHDDMATVVDGFEDDPNIDLKEYADGIPSAEDLYKLLGEPRIRVQKSGYEYNAPCAILGFDAAFDMEHGLGILTDGKEILGLGYQADAGAF